MAVHLGQNAAMQFRVYMALTESVADFELLAAGPGGVIAGGRPAGRVPDGVLGRRRCRGAAHEEERGQGQ